MKLTNINRIFIGLLLLLPFQLHAAVEHVTYYINDALGSPIMALDEAGDVIWQESYQPYGQRQTKSAAASYDEQFYTGKQEEPDIGLQYYGARWYDQEAGRFTSIDPVGVQEGNIHSFNRYVYANNNPYKYIDPDGRYSLGVGGYVTPNENRETLNQAEAVIARGEKVALAMSLGAFGVEGAVAIILGKAFSKFSVQAVTKGLTTPKKYFENKNKQEVKDALEKKYGPPKSSREHADTYYNDKIRRSYNVHDEPGHNDGKPHVDIRRRGGYEERKYDLKEGE